jgi:Flp pilus assembly protein TadG
MRVRPEPTTPRSERRRRGAALVEAAIILPITITMIIGIMEYARLITVQQVMENAAREGARYAVVRVVDDSTSDDEVQSVVESAMAGLQRQFVSYSRASNIQVFMANPTTGANIGSWKDAGFGEYIAVKVTGQVKLALGPTIPLSVEAIMYSEAN